MLDGARLLILAASRGAPVLVVVDDLQWIDSETHAFLDLLVESLPAAQVLLLVNYRPEGEHGWSGKSFYTQIRVDPLPAAGAGELLDALVGPEPALDGLKRLLVERTAGNPFFLEESVWALVETRALVGERGAYRLLTPLVNVEVPATVQAVLAARIDRLPPEGKGLLHAASAIGMDVPLALLQSIADLPDESVRRGLEHLLAGEFLYETGLWPTSSTPSSTRSPTTWRTAACSPSTAGRCTRASWRRSSASTRDGSTSTSTGWPITRCGARSGTARWTFSDARPRR